MHRIKEPKEYLQTIRQKIIEAIEDDAALSAKELSKLIHISEKEVYPHLAHVQRSLAHNPERRFKIIPAQCRRCDFVFEDRTKLHKPSRCPECKQETIEEARFSIVAKASR